MTTHTELTVRRSRQEPDKYVICVRSTGTAIEHPEVRLLDGGPDRIRVMDQSYFDDPTDAQLAIDDWRDLADTLPRKKVPFKGLAVVRVVTLQDEIKAMYKAQAAGPFAHWHPCTGMSCDCRPAPQGFRAPSKELLAMQSGKPAYGSSR